MPVGLHGCACVSVCVRVCVSVCVCARMGVRVCVCGWGRRGLGLDLTPFPSIMQRIGCVKTRRRGRGGGTDTVTVTSKPGLSTSGLHKGPRRAPPGRRRRAVRSHRSGGWGALCPSPQGQLAWAGGGGCRRGLWRSGSAKRHIWGADLKPWLRISPDDFSAVNAAG